MTKLKDRSRGIWLFRKSTVAITLIGAAGLAALSGASPALPAPLIHWNFEDLAPTNTQDAAGNLSDTIGGRYTEVRGVTGKAIRLDGFTFSLNRPAKKVPALKASFTVDAWIALGAYPWNWAPVVTQLKPGVEGFFFGVGPRGQFGMEVTINDELYRCVSDDFVLPLRTWSHVAAVVKEGDGLYLYLNGQPVGSAALKKAFRQAKDGDLRVGMNYTAVKPSHQIGDKGTLPYWFSLDGILDEIRVFGEALSADQVKSYVAGLGTPAAPDLPIRKLPTGLPANKGFGAFYTKLSYYPEWDALWPVGDDPDIVVTFGTSPVRLVFWRGTRYGPAWISETGLWMADQSVEAWDGKEGCYEHMEDPKCLYSHVRLIENTPARVVVHWRYAPVSAHNHLWQVNEKTGWGVWVDEYYYIYPDGTGLRKVCWNTDALGYPRQFQESLPLTSPGQKQGEIMDQDWVSVANLKGETQTFQYIANPPAENTKPIPEKPNIQRHNFTSRFDPFIIFEPGNRMNYLKDRDIRDLEKYGSCNHWPVGLANTDGRRAQTGDQPTHFLGFPISGPIIHNLNGRSHWVGIYGMTDQPIGELVRLGRSWARPATVKGLKGKLGYSGFVTAERAFVFEQIPGGDGSLGWEWEASAESPLVRPVAIIKNGSLPSGGVYRDGKKLQAGQDYQVGEVRRLEGDQVVLWLNFASDQGTTLELKR